MTALVRDESDAVLVPLPQYPLYSASCSLFGEQREESVVND